MLATEQDDFTLRVSYRSYVIALLLLMVPPLMLYELGGKLLDGSIDRSELAGLILANVLPLLAACYLLDFARISFSRGDDRFRRRRRGLLGEQSGEVPLARVVKVRREALASSSGAGPGQGYRLVVILDDSTIIPLTRGFSDLHDRQLKKIVSQIRAQLGHFVPLR